MRWGFASGPAGDSLPATITPSHTAMRCFRLPAVGRCGGAADDGHTITRTATITHGHALLPTACILGGASRTAAIIPPRPCAACVWHLRWVCRRPCEMLRASDLHTHGHHHTRPCAASDCLHPRRGITHGHHHHTTHRRRGTQTGHSDGALRRGTQTGHSDGALRRGTQTGHSDGALCPLPSLPPPPPPPCWLS